MSTRSLFISLALVSVCLGCPSRAAAHRLDEYLQATRLSVERDRVGVEIDLTAGVNIAPQVFALLDTNHNGQISSAEGDAYAREVLSSIALSVDGRSLPIILVHQQFPDFREMALGVGTIRFQGTATLPAASAGRHQVLYRNTHLSEIGVYLVNALVPVDKQIAITGMERDHTQHQLTVDYRVIPNGPQSWPWWLIAGLAMAGVLGVTFERARA